MFTTLDKKKQIGWTISILIPQIIEAFFYDYAVYDTDYRV